MAAKSKNILIFGATGLIGKHITTEIINELSRSDDFEKIAIFTSQDTVNNKPKILKELVEDRGAQVIAGDITSEDDVNAAFKGFDTVVSCVGRPVIHTQLNLVELADKHPDIKRFFPSEYGTDIEYGPKSKDEKPHQQKLKVRAALKETKNLEYTYVVTGPYGDADRALFLSATPAEDEERGTFDVRRKRALIFGTGNDKISLTTMKDVGRLVVAALKHPEAAKNRALKVNSFTATPNEIVAEFEKQTGGDKWSVTITSLEDLKKLEEQAYAKGDPTAGGYTLRRIWTEGGTLYDHRDNDVIDMEDPAMDSLQDAVKQAIKVQEEQWNKSKSGMWL